MLYKKHYNSCNFDGNLPGFFFLIIQSGHGVDEQSIISLLGRSRAEHRQTFRKECKEFFIEDNERRFERWDDHSIKLIKQEFMRFKVQFSSFLQFSALVFS